MFFLSLLLPFFPNSPKHQAYSQNYFTEAPISYPRDTILYDEDVIMVTKREFCSLLPHTLIEVGVINAWASYLNNMEEYKALSSSRRLFFTTYPSVFFPICATEHYYTICFRFSTKSIVVIDNSKNGDDEDITVKYGSIPKTVRVYFCHYLTKKGITSNANQ
ncbi:uncharacterized protein LOC121793612 [Salvia splendens]|uniref:uncharacterized protein LOC121793612 n=1 Tax=Salvia splendens TaxID=180675 RepID=UPI001C25E02A|nr:uncharacterized protein LOC121793612 [Salvia splendens]